MTDLTASPADASGARSGPLADHRRIARSEGLLPALRRLLDDLYGDRIPWGPGGHAVVPEPLGAGMTVLDTLPVEGETLRALKNPDPDPDPDADAPDDDDPDRAAWSLGLARLRLGLSERLRDTVLEHLAGRTVGDSRLLQQQMVKGQVADVLTAHLEIETMLDGAVPGDPDDDTVTRLHVQITESDRMLLRLLGAAGFLRDGPGGVAHASELLADAYAGPSPDGATP
ncbi:hypothetical protein ACH35V_05485 [Actinomadura sp. 1N219]|uniref:hypothetical protein n=1 Tax=Actinomadura sp. 1N219 TaxID=3375152 RepID=UPI0037AF4132